MPQNAANLHYSHRAAKFRVLKLEAAASGGLQVSEKLTRINRALQDTSFLYRHALWKTWFHTSYAQILKTEETHLCGLGLTRSSLELALGWDTEEPRTSQQARTWKRKLQSLTAKAIRSANPLPTDSRLRSKLDRWDIPLLPRKRVQRALQRLNTLKKVVPPRVIASIIRTWFNGWCTKHRFQETQEHLCCFGCTSGPDSVEHYSTCSKLAHYAARWLRLPCPEDRRERRMQFLLLSPDLTDHTLTIQALHLAACYRIHCRVRRLPADQQPRTDTLTQALRMSCREVARGADKAMAALDQIWRSPADSLRHVDT